MYFNQFPITEYNFPSIGVVGKEMLDILVRVKFLFNSVFSERTYSEYTLKHGDTPDIVAHNYYGSSDWWWLVLLYNDVVNPFNELPRLGLDYTISGSSVSRENPVVYIQKEGGDEFQDFKEGDTIVKLRSDTVTVSGAYRQWVQPQPLQPSNSDFASAKILNWRNAFREATLTDIDGSNFYVGDTIGVLTKKRYEPTRLHYWGKILLTVFDSANRIDHFIENKSGRVVHPHYSVQERVVKPSGPLFDRGDTTKSLSGTLINAVLGGSGSSGTTYSDAFTAIVAGEKAAETEDVEGKIKLLHHTHRDQAFGLLTTLLRERNMTYATFSTSETQVSQTPFFNLPGSGPSTSSTTIY